MQCERGVRNEPRNGAETREKHEPWPIAALDHEENGEKRKRKERAVRKASKRLLRETDRGRARAGRQWRRGKRGVAERQHERQRDENGASAEHSARTTERCD